MSARADNIRAIADAVLEEADAFGLNVQLLIEDPITGTVTHRTFESAHSPNSPFGALGRTIKRAYDSILEVERSGNDRTPKEPEEPKEPLFDDTQPPVPTS